MKISDQERLLDAWREIGALLRNTKAKPALRVELALHVMDRPELVELTQRGGQDARSSA